MFISPPMQMTRYPSWPSSPVVTTNVTVVDVFAVTSKPVGGVGLVQPFVTAPVSLIPPVPCVKTVKL